MLGSTSQDPVTLHRNVQTFTESFPGYGDATDTGSGYGDATDTGRWTVGEFWPNSGFTNVLDDGTVMEWMSTLQREAGTRHS